MGSQALDMVRIEAGFILVDPTISAPCTRSGRRNARARSKPASAGPVGLKEDAYFVGKRALQQEKARGMLAPHPDGIEVEGRKPPMAPSSMRPGGGSMRSA